jgi:GTP-binding protein
VSNAKPKIADYPFTTLVPNLGIVKYGNYNSFVMADIPGLIEGASDGKGLGSQFLRHIERTKVLVYLVECIDEEIYKNFVTLKNELKRHNPELIKRPSLLLLTKTDLIPTELLELEKIAKEIPIVQISSVSGQNLNDAIQAIAELIQSQTHDPEIPAD